MSRQERLERQKQEMNKLLVNFGSTLVTIMAAADGDTGKALAILQDSEGAHTKMEFNDLAIRAIQRGRAMAAELML